MDDISARHRLVIERTLRWRHYAWYWGDAIAVDGLLAAPVSLAPMARDSVIEQLEHWAATAPDNFDDVLAPGLAIMSLARSGALQSRAVDRFVASVDRLPTLPCGLPALEPQRPAFRFGFCIDALYHLPPAMAALGVWRHEPARVRAAAEMALRGIDVLACPTGWAQWYDDTVERNNAIAWSRGIGWALLGTLDLLAELDDSDPAGRQHVAELEDHAARMLDRLAATQAASGNWAAVLDDELAPQETSTAAFFVAGARHARLTGVWTAPTEVLAKAEDAVMASIAVDGLVTGVSADILPAWEINGYRAFGCEPSPWAQGAGLRALAVMDRAPLAAGDSADA
ncbi:MAG TPA: glycoside hydrolase family 88 protein [Actinomycetales bacterium]|nr:glycoside hydrolase family 88 protein [Actinomycetales bacterium]